jgi:hypothetical protein
LRKAEDSIRDVAARQKVPADVRQPADPQKKSATRLGVALNPPKEEGGGDKLADSSARSYKPAKRINETKYAYSFAAMQRRFVNF